MGCCFFLLKIPDTPNLDNYKTARKIMSAAYISLAFLYLIEMVLHPQTPNMQLSQSITITVGSLQAFLFTYTFISLINLQFVSRKKIIVELSVILLLSVLLFAAFVHKPQSSYFYVVFYSYILYYISMLIRYTILFLKEYRNYSIRLDNFFSEEEYIRYRWIRISFFAALAIGICALLLTFSVNAIHYVIFCMVFIVFYSYFGVKFIEYAYSFNEIEPILAVSETRLSIDENNSINNQLEDSISEWIAKEKYLATGITIKQLSKELNTNRTYLSSYINSVERKSFREWINYLRIEKSKEILLNKPHLSITEIAGITGYSDNSSFNRHFAKVTGISASVWKTKNSIK